MQQYFENDKYLSQNEIVSIIAHKKWYDDQIGHQVKEKVKALSGRSVLSGQEVKLVTAVCNSMQEWFRKESLMHSHGLHL